MCWSAMNLGIIWIGYILLKKVIEWDESNASIKIKHISLLKQVIKKNSFLY